MVQLLIRLTAPAESARDVLSALRAVMLTAQQTHECSFAQVYHRAGHEAEICYMEEWANDQAMREQFATERFKRLLMLLEIAAELPVVEFRTIAETRGLDYVTASRDAIDTA